MGGIVGGKCRAHERRHRMDCDGQGGRAGGPWRGDGPGWRAGREIRWTAGETGEWQIGKVHFTVERLIEQTPGRGTRCGGVGGARRILVP